MNGMDNMRLLLAENQRLKRAVDELSILNELASAIGALKTSEEVIRKILSRSLRAMDAEQGVITLVEEQPEHPMKTLVRASVSSSEHGQFHFDQALLGWMVLNRRPLSVNSPATDERFRGLHWDDSVRSVLCVPMLVRSVLMGVLAVYNKKDDGGFTEEDQRLLAIIASQSAQVVENARLYEEERALIQVRHELNLASQIQMDLLPKGPPSLPGYDIAGATFPAGTVGGDYFDFIPLDEHRIAFCVGDISGKGLPAALLMTNLQASLHGVSDTSVTAKECVSKLNEFLFRRTGPEKFATFFYGILDGNRNEMTYCNAGHEPPFLFSRSGEPARLSEGGTVIGIGDAFPFQDAAVCLQCGDIFVAFSDGITEAANERGGRFGEANLSQLVKENSGLRAAELIEKIVCTVLDCAGKTPQLDDMTVLVIKREIHEA